MALAKNYALSFYTFGGFTAAGGRGKICVQEGKKRPWKLLLYLLSRRDTVVAPSDLHSLLWPGEEVKKPDKVIRNHMYRLRKELEKLRPGAGDRQEGLIQSWPGGYLFNLSSWCYLDSCALETAYRKGIAEKDSEERFRCFQTVVEVYRGEYLPQFLYEDWINPLRTYYHSLYVRSALEVIAFYLQKGRWQEALNLNTHLLCREPYEEEGHKLYLETLIAMGRLEAAEQHYQNISAMFQRELGLAPSYALETLMCGKGKSWQKNTLKVFLTQVRERENEVQYCSPGVFRKVYSFLTNRGDSLYLLQCILPRQQDSRFFDETLKAKQWQKTLYHGLGEEALCTSWNERQYLFLFQGLQEGERSRLETRLEEIYREVYGLDGISPAIHHFNLGEEGIPVAP